jgi:hypothetical protein
MHPFIHSLPNYAPGKMKSLGIQKGIENTLGPQFVQNKKDS